MKKSIVLIVMLFFSVNACACNPESVMQKLKEQAAKAQSNLAVDAQLRQPGVTAFFSKECEPHKWGIFCTSEVQHILHTLREKRAQTESTLYSFRKLLCHLFLFPCYEIKEYPIKVAMERRLRFYHTLYFLGSIERDGKVELKVASREHKNGGTSYADRKPREIKEKKEYPYCVVGREQTDGTFIWEKVVHQEKKMKKPSNERKDDGMPNQKAKGVHFPSENSLKMSRSFFRDEIIPEIPEISKDTKKLSESTHTNKKPLKGILKKKTQPSAIAQQ